MKKIGQFEVKTETFSTEINIKDLKIGVNSVKNHFVIVDNNYKIEHVIDKTCDHAGGKLIKKGTSAICPMHGWKLNFKTLKYQDSHIEKTSIDFTVSNNILKFNDNESYLVNPHKVLKNKNNFKLRWLNHACTLISNENLSIVTDPWLKGPAFLTGWWLDKPSPSDSIELVQNADYIYISHNHPDHLHPETLSLVDKNKKIIVGNFSSNSTEKYLKSLGFKNIYSLEFNEIYEIGEDFQVSVLKSGDFRDDSGLYLNIEGIETLLTVDSNFLNSYILPKNIDLLLTSFAGGASGFPLCYDNYSLEEKNKINKRSKLAIRASVLGYLNSTLPKNYMPYAGMFKEKAKRDSFIKDNNSKNNTEVYREIVVEKGINYLAPKNNIIYNFIDGQFLKKKIDINYLPSDKTEDIIANFKALYEYNSTEIINYLKKSRYIANQIVYIIPTNDDFSDIVNDIIFCDFKNHKFLVVKKEDIIEELKDFRTMHLYVREEIFAAVVKEKLPWEDFSIGFQMRVTRFPNEYESDFWYHFTNIYINSIHYKNDPNCGACEVINQNPVFNKKYK